MTDYPKQGTAMDTKDHPDVQYPNGFRTIQIGDYPMPQMGKPSEYKEKK